MMTVVGKGKTGPIGYMNGVGRRQHPVTDAKLDLRQGACPRHYTYPLQNAWAAALMPMNNISLVTYNSTALSYEAEDIGISSDHPHEGGGR